MWGAQAFLSPNPLPRPAHARVLGCPQRGRRSRAERRQESTHHQPSQRICIRDEWRTVGQRRAAELRLTEFQEQIGACADRQPVRRRTLPVPFEALGPPQGRVVRPHRWGSGSFQSKPADRPGSSAGGMSGVAAPGEARRAWPVRTGPARPRPGRGACQAEGVPASQALPPATIARPWCAGTWPRLWRGRYRHGAGFGGTLRPRAGPVSP